MAASSYILQVTQATKAAGLRLFKELSFSVE
jgi:hypothetical protein